MFDEALHLFDTGPIRARGYADDLVLLASGIDPLTISNLMQEAINTAADWGIKVGLKFSPTKTTAMLFTRKRIKYGTLSLMINGSPISWAPTVKYLGITFDQKLTWTEHVKQKLKKAKAHLFMYKLLDHTLVLNHVT